jgi:AP-1 complex subunit beta-1
MDFLATYVPENEKEAETILERILPRLSHKNPAVVLAAVKIIIKYLDLLTSAEVIKLFC